MIIIQMDSEQLSDMIENAVRKVINEVTSKSGLQQEHSRKFLTIAEAGEFLNLAKQTIYGLVSTGKMPYMKQGKKLYFDKNELVNWLKEGRSKVRKTVGETVDKMLSVVKKKVRKYT